MPKKLNLEFVHDFLSKQNKNLICLSDKYVNSSTLLDIKHNAPQCGYVFKIDFNRIKNQNTGCPNCCKNKKLTIEFVHDYLSKHTENIICLSEKYKNNSSLLEFKHNILNCGHVWKAAFHGIKDSKSKCPKCFGTHKFTNEYVYSFLKSKNIFSKDEYINVNKKMNYNCILCKHNWATNFHSILNSKFGCPKCAGVARHTQEFIYDFLKNIHIETTDEYVNILTIINCKCLNCKYKWKSNLHKFLHSNSRCPSCCSSSGELYCKYIFEKLFGYEFAKIRPNFLRYINKKNLEIDGFCQELNVAFEHQGRQHFEIIAAFEIGEESLKRQQERDQFKREKCKEFGIKLLEIYQVTRKTNLETLKRNIKEKCIELNITLPENYDNIKLNHKEINDYISIRRTSTDKRIKANFTRGKGAS